MCSIQTRISPATEDLATLDAAAGDAAGSGAAATARAEVRPLPELEREICQLAAHLAAGMCRWLLLLAEFDERRGWEADGIVSCAHWLSWRCSIGLRAAREHMRVARALRELPLICGAFARGELSYCKVRALTRVATADTEEALVEVARHATGAQLETLARGYRAALQASTEQAARAYQRRFLHWSFDQDGSLVLEGRLPAEEGALLVRTLEALVEQPMRDEGGSECSAEHLGGRSDADLDPVSAAERDPARAAACPVGARRADALMALVRSGLDGDLGTVRRGGDPVQLMVHVDTATLTAERVRECAEIEDGPVLAPEVVRRLGCDASLTRIIERDGRPLSISRRNRTVPPSLRRALRARDGGCAFPGCTHTRFLHAHHIHHWARGGPTTLENLVQLCSHHHRLVHEGGYHVERVGTHGVRFRRPNGRLIPPVPPPVRPRGAGLEEQHWAGGLSVDERTIRPLSAGEKLDYDHALICLLAIGGQPPRQRPTDMIVNRDSPSRRGAKPPGRGTAEPAQRAGPARGAQTWT